MLEDIWSLDKKTEGEILSVFFACYYRYANLDFSDKDINRVNARRKTKKTSAKQ